MTSEYFVVHRGATALSNKVINDDDLSMQAVGILLRMLTLPPGAPMGYRELMGRGFGETVTRRAMAELEAKGYRWRVLVRRDGKLRTITMVYDKPTEEQTALEDARRATGLDIVGCASSRGSSQQKALSHCAEVSTAQPDKGKRGDRSAGSNSKTPSRTVQRFPGPRRTVASVAPAQPSNDGSSGWETNVSQPNQTKPARDDGTRGALDGRVGSGLDGLLDHAAGDVPESDWDVLVECLPPQMRGIEPSAMAKVAAALSKRVDAGWSPDALRATLGGNSLPPAAEVRNLAGIVSYRIGQVPVSPPKRGRRRSSPSSGGPATVEPATPRAQPLAFQMRAKARAERSPDASQPMSWWFEQFPGTSSEAGGEGAAASG